MTEDKNTARPPEKGASAFEKLAREIAQRDALEQFEYLPHNSRLYSIEKSWKSFMIESHPKGVQVESLSELERAVANPDIKIIFIPARAIITDEGIRRVCQRNAVSKSIIKEVEND